MRICIISPEYPPFPGSDVARQTERSARLLADAGHDVHVVTNRARHGADDLKDKVDLWREGNLTVHRLDLFDARRQPSRAIRFFELDPVQYPNHEDLWANDWTNLTAAAIAGFVASLHAVEDFDVIEVPERLGAGYYLVRQRHATARPALPPICVIGHGSTREVLRASGRHRELGSARQRELMAREEYCLQHADAVLTPTRSMLERYEADFPGALPSNRHVVPFDIRVDDADPELPPELTASGRYVVAASDTPAGTTITARAFAELAPRYDDLKLVIHARGSRAGDLAADDDPVSRLDARWPGRVIRLGRMPRSRELAVMRDAAAVVFPSPVTTCPFGALEAMAIGARCVVAADDSRSEVPGEGNGVTFERDDPKSLAGALRRLLDDPSLGPQLAERARTHVTALAAEGDLTTRKIEVYGHLVEQERPAREDGDEPPLPGRGVLVLDVAGVDEKLLASTTDWVDDAVTRSPGWRVSVLVEEGPEPELPLSWHRYHRHEPPPWLDLDDDDAVLWVRGGTRFDEGCAGNLVHLVRRMPAAAGASAWLRPPDIQVFPYAPDGGFHDMLTEGALIPPATCFRAARLKGIRNLEGQPTGAARGAALVAVATLASGGSLVHTAHVEGDYYGRLALVTRTERELAMGLADSLGLLPAQLITTYGAPTAMMPVQTAAGPSEELQYLRQVHDEHMRLKNHRVVRIFRKLKMFDLMRRVLPGSKRYLGSGRSG